MNELVKLNLQLFAEPEEEEEEEEEIKEKKEPKKKTKKEITDDDLEEKITKVVEKLWNSKGAESQKVKTVEVPKIDKPKVTPEQEQEQTQTQTQTESKMTRFLKSIW